MSDQADRAMANLTARLCGQPEPFPRRPAPAPLRAVTAENAHEFSPASRKRGRPRKIDARDNVVMLRPARSKVLQLPSPPNDPVLHAEVSGVAIANVCRDLSDSEASGLPMRMTYREHLAAVWIARGYLPPGA